MIMRDDQGKIVGQPSTARCPGQHDRQRTPCTTMSGRLCSGSRFGIPRGTSKAGRLTASCCPERGGRQQKQRRLPPESPVSRRHRSRACACFGKSLTDSLSVGTWRKNPSIRVPFWSSECASCVPNFSSYPRGECALARKNGQIIARGAGRWLVRVSLSRDRETGRRRYLNRTIRGGFRAAQRYLNSRLEERCRGEGLEGEGLTLNQYLARWLELAARPKLRTKSYRDYRALLGLHVCPALGERELQSLTSLDLQRVYHRCTKRGCRREPSTTPMPFSMPPSSRLWVGD